jgi:hypothetical protein
MYRAVTVICQCARNLGGKVKDTINESDAMLKLGSRGSFLPTVLTDPLIPSIPTDIHSITCCTFFTHCNSCNTAGRPFLFVDSIYITDVISFYA